MDFYIDVFNKMLIDPRSWIVIVALIVFYIIAQVLSRRTECIIIWGWWDMILLMIPAIILFVVIYEAKKGKKIRSDDKEIASVLFYIFLCLTGIMSIIANKLNIFYISVSIISKTIVAIIFPIAILFFLASFSTGKIDRRYRDGTKNNERTMWIRITNDVYTFLVKDLIKRM